MSLNNQHKRLWDFLLNTIPFGRPFLNPGPVEIGIVAPHLDPHEIKELLNPADVGRFGFIGPGLVIRGAVHHYYLVTAAGQQSLYRSHAMRVRASYACTRAPVNIAEPTSPFVERVVDYAEINWGDELCWDRACDAVHGTVMAPPGSAWGDREFISLVDCSLAKLVVEVALEEPFSELLDDAILETYQPRFAAEEALGQRTPYKANYCGRCGGGLAGSRCSFCGQVYDFGTLPTSDWPYPLCLSMLAEVLESGYEFEIDPTEARKAEHRKWARSEFRLPQPDAAPPLRSIVLGDSVEH